MIVGEVFKVNSGGFCTVVNYISSREVEVEFNDEYRYKTKTSSGHVRNGRVRNPYNRTLFGVGYLGEGKHLRSVSGKGNSDTYKIWRGMLERCYSESRLDKYDSYEGCTVHPDWHNFQNFAGWYESHECYGLGYELDKDLFGSETKVYSEETCCLLPKVFNKTISYKYSSNNGNPVGCTKGKGRNTFSVQVMVARVRHYVGSYRTEEEARQAYLDAKQGLIKNLVEGWEGKLEDKVKVKLLNCNFK